jgi:hypothetical protein
VDGRVLGQRSQHHGRAEIGTSGCEPSKGDRVSSSEAVVEA